MLSLAALMLAGAAPEAPPASAQVDGHYECDATSAEPGWMSVRSTLRADGSPHSTFASWNGPAEAGEVQFAIYWQFTLNEPRPYSAYVTITAPLRRKVSGIRLLNLVKVDGAGRGQMALGAPTRVDGRLVSATADLKTLLDYAGTQPELLWQLVRPEPDAIPTERGWLGLKRLRDALARFETLLDEHNAKRADFRTRCTWTNEPINEEEDI
jgi:hypothetical protein